MIQHLAGFMQNDLSLLLENKEIAKEEIKSTIDDINDSYNNIISKLTIVRGKSINIINKYL